MAPLPPPSPLPEYVYKIIPSAPPDPIPSSYPLSDLDKQDGFVHLSTSWQACPHLPMPHLTSFPPLLFSVLCKTEYNTDTTNHQKIPITSDLFFKDTTSFHIFKLRLANFDASSVKWDEVDGTNGCPHLYGNFGAQDVVAVKQFRRGAGQTWKEVFAGETGWLE
jgi:uncharacterized protein (DUF952 family)